MDNAVVSVLYILLLILYLIVVCVYQWRDEAEGSPVVLCCLLRYVKACSNSTLNLMTPAQRWDVKIMSHLMKKYNVKSGTHQKT